MMIGTPLETKMDEKPSAEVQRIWDALRMAVEKAEAAKDAAKLS